MGIRRRGAGRAVDELGIAQRLERAFFAVAALIVLTGALAVASFVVELAVFRPQLDTDIDARGGARVAHQGMLDQQAGLRGYLLTGNRSLLDTYDKGRQELASGEATVEATVGNNSHFATLVTDVRRAEQAWIDGWARPVVGGGGAPSDLGPAVRDRDAHLFAGYQAVDDRLIGAIVDQYDAAHRDETLAQAVSGGLRVLIVGVLLAFVVRQQRRLRRAVATPFEALLATIRRVRDGDLSVHAAVQGPAELRQVAAGFNEMTRALAEERSLRASRETEVMFNATRLRDLLETARNLAGSLNLRYTLDAVSSHAVSLSACEQATVWLADEDRLHLSAALTPTPGGTGAPERPPVAMGQGCVGQAARNGRIVHGGGAPDDPAGAQSVTCVPMIVGARVVGVIELASFRTYSLPDNVVELVEILASHAGTAIEAARLHARTEELSQVDALTQLFNRRRLEADIDRECRRSRRYGHALAFCMMDVDHFKDFNDRHGHRRGDAVLEQVGELLREGMRSSDSAYRYGGEEFGLLLRDTPLSAAVALCERLRTAVAATFSDEAVTASFGVAVLTEGMSGPGDLIEAADQALYRAKGEGRNRVAASEEADIDGRGEVRSQAVRQERRRP